MVSSLLWSEYLFPPQIHLLKFLTPKVMVLGEGAWEGSSAIMNGIVPDNRDLLSCWSPAAV